MNDIREEISYLVSQAVDETNKLLVNPPQPIQPGQIHIVEQLPPGIKRGDPIRWKKEGLIFVHNVLILETVKSRQEKGEDDAGIEKAVVNLLKSVIARYYYIICLGYREWVRQKTEAVSNVSEVSKIGEALNNHAERLNLTFHEHHISAIDETLQKERRAILSYNFVIIAAKYGTEAAEKLERLIPRLSHMSLPSTWPSTEAFIAFINNRNVPFLAKKGILSLERLVERSQHNIFSEVPHDYFLAMGYRFIYLPEGLVLEGKKLYPQPTKVHGNIYDIRKIKPSQKVKKLRREISKFNTLIDANFAGLELMFTHSETLTPRITEAIIEHLEMMVDLYGLLVSLSGGDDVEPVNKAFKEMISRFRKILSPFGPNEVLPEEIRSQVTRLEPAQEVAEVKTINEMFNYVHLRSFSALDRLAEGLGKDYSFLLKDKLKLIDANERPWIDSYGTVINPLMRSVLSWVEEETEGRIVLVDYCLWAHIRMGDHSAVVHVHPFPPDEGGLLGIAYAEGIDNKHPLGRAFRVELVKRIFEYLHMRVSIRGDNEFVQAILDKDSGIKTSKDIFSAFHIAMSGLNATRNIDITINELSLSGTEQMKIAHDWADIFIAEKDFPFKAPNPLGSLFVDDVYTPGFVSEEPRYDKYLEYKERKEQEWPPLHDLLNRELKRLCLPEIPAAQKVIGQQVIDTYFNNPLRLGLEMEAFLMIEGRAERKEDYLSRRSLFHHLALEPAHVLFVCTGNTCRSNMAEQITKHLLREAGKSDIKVLSRGTFVETIRIRPVVYKSLSSLEIPLPRERHIPTQISEKAVREADIILVMGEEHKEYILQHYPGVEQKVFLLTEFSSPEETPRDIPEPYGLPDSVYEAVAKDLKENIVKIIRRFREIDRESLKTGAMVRQLEGYLRFETIGGMGRYLVQRAALETGGDKVNIYALRDTDTHTIVYASAYQVRVSGKGYNRRRLEPFTLYTFLEKTCYPTSPPLEITDAQRSAAHQKLYARPYHDILGQYVKGLGVSEGTGRPVYGTATYQRGHSKQEGKIFIAPFTTPDDLEAIKEASAVITTGGGVLSHAAITTREFKVPSVIVHNAEWAGKDRYRHIVFKMIFPENYTRSPEGIWLSSHVTNRSIHLREDDILIVDGLAGTVMPFNKVLQKDLKPLYNTLKMLWKGAEKDLLNLTGLLKATTHLEALRFSVNYFINNSKEIPFTLEPVLKTLRCHPYLAEDWRHYEEHMMDIQIEKAWKIMDIYLQSLASSPSSKQVRAFVASAGEKIEQLLCSAKVFTQAACPIPSLFSIQSRAEDKCASLRKKSLQQVDCLLARQHELSVNNLQKIRRIMKRAEDNGVFSKPLSEKLKGLEDAKKKEVKKTVETNLVLPLEQLDEDYIQFAGGKNTKLGMLLKACMSAAPGLTNALRKLGYEFSVPPGFALTTSAYREFLRREGIDRHVDAIALSDTLSPGEKSRRMERLICEHKITPQDELGKAVLGALQKYITKTGTPWFAVRSSAVHEDAESAAYAGMGKTALFVNEETLLEKIGEIEASAWTERAIIYCRENKIHPLEIRQALAIQEMVDSEVSGIIFTEDPVTHNHGRVVINAGYGLGEALVSGLVLGDQYITDKQTGEETGELFIGTKRIKIIRNPNGPGTKTEYVDLKQRGLRSLSFEQTKALTLISRYIEEFFGYAVDIEFGIKENTIWIVQARPITTGMGKFKTSYGTFPLNV